MLGARDAIAEDLVAQKPDDGEEVAPHCLPRRHEAQPQSVRKGAAHSHTEGAAHDLLPRGGDLTAHLAARRWALEAWDVRLELWDWGWGAVGSGSGRSSRIVGHAKLRGLRALSHGRACHG